jgi:hypothetical protein
MVFTRRVGANFLARENLAADLKRRNYPEEAIGKILGVNYSGSCAWSCHNPLLMPE